MILHIMLLMLLACIAPDIVERPRALDLIFHYEDAKKAPGEGSLLMCSGGSGEIRRQVKKSN